MLSERRKLWLVHRNAKNLKLRTRKKQYIKIHRQKENERNRIINEERRRITKLKTFTFVPPSIFSLINNHENTAEFFSNLLKFITDKENFGNYIYIDISNVRELTIDALMYLLAIINNLNVKFAGKYSFSGNLPHDEKIRELLNKCGFFKYVKFRNGGNVLPCQSNDTVQIVSGQDSDTEIAKSISDFVCRIASINKSKCGFLYDIMIELMSNTYKHAYHHSENVLSPHWYCFAEFDQINTISFSFVDTGEGIPSTVQKKLGEKIDVLKMIKDDIYVVSALNGEKRTSTKLSHRGKGLPKINKYCKTGKIKNMQIITNKANVMIDSNDIKSNTISCLLQGTLYYWQIKIDDLKGEFI